MKLQLPETLAVPRSAVLSPGAQPVVYVDKTGGAYEQRRVSLGRAGDSFWEVLDGLAAGERVVTTGNLLIDAQAQLNRSALPPSEHNMPTVATNSASAARDKPTSQALSEALTDRQLDALKEFFSGADALASALAQDNLASFNQHAASLGSALAALTNAFSSFPAWNKFVQPFASSGRVPPANNLAGARKTFLPFSSEVVAFVQELRAARKEFAALKIYRCPMTNRAFPGAPKTGAWMQAEGPLRNPFFGAEMLDCGSEVQP